MKKTLRTAAVGAAIVIACAAVATPAARAQAQDAALAEAEAMIGQGRAAEAYARLSAQEMQRAGDANFDALLGMAALQAGHPTRAVFALERALAVNPDHGPARLALAQAYFAMGENEAARETFRAVQGRSDLPPIARVGVDRYLAALDDRTRRTIVSGHLSTGFGYDSNVNAATDDTSILIPALAALGPATLSASAREQDSAVHVASAAIGVEHRVTDRFALLAGAGYARRDALESGDFDQDTIDLSAGASYRLGEADMVIGSLQWQRLWVDGDGYRNAWGGTVSVRHAFDDRTFLTGFGQVLKLDYPDQSVRDALRITGGVIAAHTFDAAWAPTLFGQLYAGTEQQDRDGLNHLGHDFVGVRAGVQAKPWEGGEVFASVTYENRDYGGTEPLFLVSRADDQVTLAGGMKIAVAEAISIVPEASYTIADSNVVLNDYDRFTGTLSVRWDF